LKYVVVFELLTRCQTRDVIHLLDLLAGELRTDGPRVKIEVNRVFTKGYRFSQIDRLFSDPLVDRVNRVDIDSEGRRAFGLGKIDCGQTLSVSPTSGLWASVTTYNPEKPPKDIGAVGTWCDVEYRIKGSAVKNCPTGLRTVFTVDEDVIDDQRFVGILTEALLRIPEKLDVFGVAYYGHVLPEMELPPGTLEHLQRWNKCLDELGDKFAYLCEWMMGGSDTLHRMSKLIPGSYVIPLTGRKAAILRIPEEALEQEMSPALASFIVERNDVNKWYVPGEGEDEFSFGRPFFVRRRYELLRASDRIPISPWFPENAVLPIMAERYCKMIGVDPLDMLVSETYDYLWEDFQSDVDRFFAETDVGSPIIDRVWQAHVRAFNAPGKWNTRRPNRDLIRFVHDRYFAEAE
jgi:hypothetical protein